MADDKIAETELVPTAAETSAEPKEIPPTLDVSKDTPTEGTASSDPQEDTYESVSPPADVEKLLPEAEKSNGNASADAAAIEVPLDENEEASQPLTGEKDVEAAGTSEPNSTSLAVHARILAALKRREVLLPVVGAVTFFLGLILLITGLIVMHGKCETTVTPNGHINGQSGQVVTYPDNTHMSTHDDDKNSTVDDTLMENVALGRTAYQLTTFTDKGIFLNASFATDGNTGSSMTKGECAQTERMLHPEWYVDLDDERIVNWVRIHIPTNCCVGELHDFVVRVGSNTDRTENKVCKHFMGTALRTTIDMECTTPLTGRFVSIHLLRADTKKTPDRLSLCEVLVYSRKTDTPEAPSGV